MSVNYPEALWGLLGLIPLAALVVVRLVQGAGDVQRLGGTEDGGALLKVYRWKAIITGGCILLFYASSILALSDITYGEREVPVERSGLEVAIVLDVSRGMPADDVDPNRLGLGVDAVQHTIGELDEAYVSLTVFRGSGSNVVPMTADRTLLKTVLETAGPGYMTAPGTDIESGLVAALDSIGSSTRRQPVVLLVSDGEELSGDMRSAADRIARQGIPIFAVGVGTTAGSTVTLSGGSLLRDAQGEIVTTYLEPEAMRDVAERTGGRYYHYSGVGTASDIAADIRETEREIQEAGARTEPIRRYPVFVGLAVSFMALMIGVRVVKWRELF